MTTTVKGLKMKCHGFLSNYDLKIGIPNFVRGVCLIDSMKKWQIHFLGRQEIPKDLTAFELKHFFTFSDEERAAIFTRRGSRLRLGASVQLGFMKLSGRPLDSIDSISFALLTHLGEHLDLEVPQLASLKTLYAQRATMFVHQKWARETLGFKEFNSRRQRVLVTYLKEQSQYSETTEELSTAAKVWLYERRILIPGHRRIADFARSALGGAAAAHAAAVRDELSAEVLQRWEKSLVRRHKGRSRLEWLQERPRRLSQTGMKTIIEKIQFLRRLGAHKYTLNAIRLDRQHAYARGARRRRPARLMEFPPETRAITVACFIRISLLELTDMALAQFEMRAAKMVRKASDTAREKERQSAVEARESLEEIRRMLDDDTIPDTEIREHIRSALPENIASSTHAAETRNALCSDGRRIRPLLKDLVALPLQHEPDEPLGQALSRLKKQYKDGKTTLPKNTDSVFSAVWDQHLDISDRRRALHAYEAAALEEVRRALRRGTLWSDDSLRYREHESTLIPKPDWNKGKKRYTQTLGGGSTAKDTIEKLKAAIDVGLESVSSAVKAGDLKIRGGELRLPKMEPEEAPGQESRDALFSELGSADLPQIIVDIDAQVRFSWTLLGRAPGSQKELLALYAGLLAHGTDLSLSAVERLVPGISRETVSNIMKSLEGAARLQRANSAVVEFLRQHPIAETWGDGTNASSDSMSLEASRHLWNARVDPRRRTYALGMYTHVLDQWGIVYDQPVVLNQRQVGAAIEGVVRNTVAPNIERLAVDTHGYTDFGMALSKLLGFDLCPRLRNLKHRCLYVSKGTSIPKTIGEICRSNISTDGIVEEWDGLLRLAASIREGRVSAVHAMERYGAAAKGNSLYAAGVSLGRLQRTLFLCDYFSNASFRRELLRILNHGESVHNLQRAVHRGGIGVRRERQPSELWATSGALTLLTNIVMAWVTRRMQSILDDWHKQGKRLTVKELAALKHTSPLHFEGINFRGVMHFPITEQAGRLFQGKGHLRLA